MKLLSVPLACAFCSLALVSFHASRADTTDIAGDRTSRCYEFQIPDSPEKMVSPDAADGARQVWCYEPRNQNGKRELLIYRAGQGSLSPALAALVQLDSNDAVKKVAHGSLVHGQMSVYAAPFIGLNPLGAIPLTVDEAGHVAVAQGVSSLAADRSETDSLYRKLSRGSSQTVLTRYKIVEGTFDSRLPEEKLPFHGYWWNRGMLEREGGPLRIYDALVKSMTGTDPQSSLWEAEHHSDSHVAWTGHCNGWAASSVLYPEPTKFLVDRKTHQIIQPSDVKGMLAEGSFCVNWAFYGQRYFSAADDIRDIHPDLFHKVLIYYLDGEKKPIAFDYHPNEEVDNHVISGYHFDIKPVSPGTFHVNAILHVNQYDSDISQTKGKAPGYSRAYSYTLTTDAAGEITGGKWDDTSSNPDFLWVPLAPQSGPCGWRNPKVEPAMIERVIEGLPEPEPTVKALQWTLTRPLAAKEAMTIPLVLPAHGVKYRLHWTASDFTQEDKMYFRGTDQGGAIYYEQLDRAAGSIEFNGRNLKTVEIYNHLDTPTHGGKVTIDQLEYLDADQ